MLRAVFHHTPRPEFRKTVRPIEHVDAWRRRADEWLERDLRLLTDADRFRSALERSDLRIFRQKTEDDPNGLFRWHLPGLEAPAEIVFEGFVHRVLDYHRHWTRELIEGRDVETLSPQARVLYQRFDPGVPGIAPRDLCRENQGGHFPGWLMNLAMPRYLVKQAESVRAFFRGGGPAELRSAPRRGAS